MTDPENKMVLCLVIDQTPGEINLEKNWKTVYQKTR